MGVTQRLGTIPLAIQTDSSNNVGIGGAANASYKLAVTGASLFSSSVYVGANISQLLPITTTNFQILTGCYYDGSNIIATATSGNRIINNSGNFQFNTFTGATVGASVSDTERMRITSSGNVGIGTSSPNFIAANRTSVDINGTNESILAFSNGGTARGYIFNTATDQIYWTEGSRNMQFGIAGAGFMGFGTNNTERMRITSNGEVIVAGTTSANTTSGRGNFTIGGTTTSILNFVYGTTNSAYIYASGSGADLNIVNTQTGGRLYCINNSGGVYLSTGATSWTANSDERLKDIIDNIENAVESLMTLRAVRHSWKSDINKAEHLSLIAQDVIKVFPQVIDKGKLSSKLDEEQIDTTEYLGVRYTELIPVLVKAIQEQQELINNLSAKVTALENK